jgi:hypothetical protein
VILRLLRVVIIVSDCVEDIYLKTGKAFPGSRSLEQVIPRFTR